MYVYVAEFEGRPELVKIGVATDVSRRLSALTKTYGDIISSSKFYIGESYLAIEKCLHNKFKISRVRLCKTFDGSTEFFSNSVRQDAEEILQGLVHDCPIVREDRVAKLLASQPSTNVPICMKPQERLMWRQLAIASKLSLSELVTKALYTELANIQNIRRV